MVDLRRVDIEDRNARDIQDATQDALDAVAGAPVYPFGKVVSIDREYSARFGEYVRVDSGSGDVSVNLPTVDASSAGQAVAVRKLVAGNSVNVIAADGTIDGDAELVISSVGWRLLIAREGGWDALS